jgi:hypothetical protein
VQLTLDGPGAAVAIEIYGRWPAGVPFRLKKPAGEEPVRVWEVNVLKGRVDIQAGPDEWSMSAPPGPSYFHGDSVSGPDEGGPRRGAALPAWADPKVAPPPASKSIASCVKLYRARYKDKEPDEGARELLAAADKDRDAERAQMTRRLVVFALAAMDEVDRVAELLSESKHDGVRKAAVVALRHWIGAAAGRDELLYRTLIDGLEYSKAEAATVLQLLHSPFAADQPETYETLIAYLRHGKQAVRELAHWHLCRLAAAGRDIPCDASSPEGCARAVRAWKKLIPPGELPPAPKEKKPRKKPRKEE